LSSERSEAGHGRSSAAWGIAVAALLLWPAGAARAQDAPPPVTRVLSRADMHLGVDKLFSSDVRFRWLIEVGFDLDLVDYGAGRLRLLGTYEAVEGRERRRFDLNQGTYFFELSGSRTIGDLEIAALAQHVSRHLVDRENPPAISWNEIGVRVRYAGPSRFTVELEVGRPWDLAFVDYQLTSRLRLAYERPLAGRLTLFGRGRGDLVRGNAADRRKGSGGRLEAGVRLRGEAASVELLASYERRLDAYPTSRGRERWIAIGFRVSSR
jgi:hypothetical protein